MIKNTSQVFVAALAVISLSVFAKAPSDETCRTAAINGSKFMAEAVAKKMGDDHPMVQGMKNLSEKQILKGIAKCKKEWDMPKDGKEWKCASTSTNFKEFEACNK